MRAFFIVITIVMPVAVAGLSGVAKVNAGPVLLWLSKQTLRAGLVSVKAVSCRVSATPGRGKGAEGTTYINTVAEKYAVSESSRAVCESNSGICKDRSLKAMYGWKWQKNGQSIDNTAMVIRYTVYDPLRLRCFGERAEQLRETPNMNR